MRVVIAGGHGQIALRLTALLTGRGDVVTGVVRNPDHRGDVEAAGGTALVRDLETVDATDLAEHLVGADAVVFAAGAGPTSGAPRKDTVDRAAAVSSRVTAPRGTDGASRTLPTPGSSVSRPGRRIVQSSDDARSASSAARLACR